MPKEILLVEDNPDDVELTRIAFEEAGSVHALARVGALLGVIAAVGLAYFACLALLGFPVRQMMRR